jgi:hypothetical protein
MAEPTVVPFENSQAGGCEHHQTDDKKYTASTHNCALMVKAGAGCWWTLGEGIKAQKELAEQF